MRIGTRLWLYVVACSFGVLLFATVLRLRDETELLERSTLEDRRFFGEALSAALSAGHVTSIEQVRVAFDRELRAHGEEVDVRVLSQAEARLHPALEASTLPRGEGIITYVPFHQAGEHAVLALVERVIPHRGLRQTSLWHSIASLAMLSAVQVLVVWLLARRLVTGPLERFSARTRSIAAGDLSQRLPAHGRDELAVFARELNAMADALQRAQERAEHEASVRVGLLEQLRHGERLRMVGMLSSSLAHELGTPLAIVALQTRLIEQAPTFDVEQGPRTQAITQQVARMKAIMQNVLGFARRSTPQRADLDLAQVAARAVAMLEPMAQQRAVDVRVEGEPGLVVAADETQLLQVLTNLLVNAFQAMKDGGSIVIEVGSAKGTDATAAKVARIAVRDQGTGIAPDIRSQLFEPFFTTKNSEGTGLGLAVTAGIVADHGGRISVEDNPGGGSVFVVELPLSRGGSMLTSQPLAAEGPLSVMGTG